MQRKVITSTTAAAAVGRRRWGAASLATALVILALIAPAASAHTSAVCALTGHIASCMGTVANRTITLGPAGGRMTLNSGYGRLYLTVAPMISLSTPPMAIAANLICAGEAGGPICIGTAKVHRNKLLITTVGRPSTGTVVIRLSDAVSNPSGSDQRPTH